METIDLTKYLPKPHPAKAIMKKHHIKTATLANYLELSTPYVSNMLNGNYRMSKSVEEKVSLLIRSLEGNSVENRL